MKNRFVTEKSNKILIVAYHFPPDNAVGSIRPQKFVKYLPEFGWDPYVLTIKEKYIQGKDTSRVNDVMHASIVRSEFWRTPFQIALDIRHKLSSKGQNEFTSDKSENDQIATQKNNNSKTILNQLKTLLISLNWLPDSRMCWTFPAVAKGFALIRREKIKYIYATCPPFTTGIIGRILAGLTGAKFVLDLRDPWTLLEDRKPEEVSSPFSQYLEKKMEQSVIQRANAVITTTDNLAEALQAEDKNSKNKYYVVYNGYDEHDFPPTKPNPKFDDRFTFTYLGSFYRERSPKFFFLAIRKLIDEDLFSFANIKIRLIGNVKTARGESVQKMAEEFSLEDIVEFYDFVPYKEALQYMVYSNVLILMAPNQYYQIPGKTFEYLATKNPILALVDEGATADLIQKLCAGVTVKWSDVSDIKNAVQELYKTYLNGEDKYSQYNQTYFSRKALTKQLSDIMTQLQ